MSSVAQARAVGDPAGQADALRVLGTALIQAGREAEGRYICREAICHARRVGAAFVEEQVFRTLGLPDADPANNPELITAWRETLLDASDESQCFEDAGAARSSVFYGYGDKPRDTYRISEISFVELACGFVVVKFLGPFIESFATKLGERLGESTTSAIGRLRLLWDRRSGHRDIDVLLSDGKTTTLVIPDPLTDAARLAIIDLDITDGSARGKQLHWDVEKGVWYPS